MKRLVLFDVDGTLLLCGRQIGHLFVDSLTEVYGPCQRPEGYSFAGKTDPRIVLDLVGATGRPAQEILPLLPAMQEVYFRRLEGGLEREKMRLLPGVVELLDRLAVRQDLVLGLLTGNWQGGARIKLGRFGLERYFAFGAFGDDGVDRRDLVPVALARAAAASGHRFAASETVIIGDSELDVDCARAAGAACLAVATGYTPAERLAAAGADWVVPDLVHAAREVELLRA